MGFKNAVLTAGIGALGTIAVNGLKPLNILVDNLTTPTQPVGVVYAAPAEPSLWWDAMKWSLPVFVYGVIACLVFVSGAACYNVIAGGKKTEKKEVKETKLPKDYEDLRAKLFIRELADNVKATQPAPVEPPKPKIEWLTIMDAFSRSKEREWIIGQACEQQPNRESSKQAVGSLLKVDYRTTQFAILGGSGGGKTSSTGMMFLVYAKKFKLHPIVLDGKDGLDFGPLSDCGVIEWYKITPENLAGFLKQLKDIYVERHAIMRKAGVSNIYALPPSADIKPLFVMVEEFGRVWEASGYDKEIERHFNDLFSLGRAAGIILCPIDQAPEGWSKPMRSSAKFAVCYSAQGDALKAFGEHFMGELPLKGVFSRGNVFYRAWHTAEMIDMRDLPPIQRRYLSEPSNAVSNDRQNNDDVSNASNAVSNDRLQVVQTPSNVSNAQTFEKSVTPICPHAMHRAFERLKRWDRPSEIFFQYNPEATQADLRLAMSTVEGKKPESYKAEAFKWYHVYSKNGNPALLVGKFGITEQSVKVLMS